MLKHHVATLAGLFVLVGSANASLTIATFADPSGTAASPLFTITDTTVEASWLSTGLTLSVPYSSQVFTDVQMEMLTVARTGGTLGAGVVTFWTTDYLNPVFTMTFDSGIIAEPFVVGSSELIANVVDFGGSALIGTDPLINEQFSFSFANAAGVGTQTRTYTAAMTASAEAVPEPATLTILGAGLAAYAARKRKQNA